MDIDFFEDGSSIEWYSKESLMYRKDGFSVQVVFSCYNGRWFKMGRIIMSDHLLLWEDYPNGCSNKIGKDEKRSPGTQ